jgi:hypothetical protein
MKEFIKNYYNIEIKKIHNNYFYYDNEKIKIIKYNKKENINKYINIINDKRISEFVLNKNNEIITKYKEENIILLKINDLQKEIDLEYLNIFNIDNEKLDIRDLIKEWENLIDDSEIKIKDIEKDYYIGLSEIAISMLKKEKSDIQKVIGHNIKFNEITREERHKLIEILKKFTLTIKEFRPIEEAIITAGGISIKEINPSTMESKIISGLFFAGEIIDVDAYTGGFNLQIAYSTGYTAGL